MEINNKKFKALVTGGSRGIGMAIAKKLVEDGLDHDDEIFLTTFGFLTALSLTLTGLLVLVGTKYKIVNLSSYLPYPVSRSLWFLFERWYSVMDIIILY